MLKDAELKEIERAALYLFKVVRAARRPRDERIKVRYAELEKAGEKHPRVVVAREFGLSVQRVSNIVRRKV